MRHKHAWLLLYDAILLGCRWVFLGLWRLREETGWLHIVLQLILCLELDLVEIGITLDIVTLRIDLKDLNLAEVVAETWHIVQAWLRILTRVYHTVQLLSFICTFIAQHFVGIVMQVRKADTLTLADWVAHTLRMVLKLVMAVTSLVINQVAFVLVILSNLWRLLWQHAWALLRKSSGLEQLLWMLLVWMLRRLWLLCSVRELVWAQETLMYRALAMVIVDLLLDGLWWAHPLQGVWAWQLDRGWRGLHLLVCLQITAWDDCPWQDCEADWAIFLDVALAYLRWLIKFFKVV